MSTAPRSHRPSHSPASPEHFGTLRARSPEDLLALAPVVLGFGPEESVVMLTFGAEHPFHARLPLPPVEEQTSHGRRAAAEKLLGPVRRLRVRQVVLLYYSADRRAADPIHRTLRRGLHRSGVEVLGAIHADGERWSDLDAAATEEQVPYDISAHPFVVQAIVAGRLTHGSRDELARSLDADPRELARTTEALRGTGLMAPPEESTSVLRAEGEWVHECVATAAIDARPLPVRDLARLVWAMQAVRVRDAAWSLIDRGSASGHVRLWSDVVRRTPRPFLAAPAVLLGWAAWQAGDGATAWIALDRCHEARPDDRLASYLASLLDNAVPPDAWRGGFDWTGGLP